MLLSGLSYALPIYTWNTSDGGNGHSYQFITAGDAPGWTWNDAQSSAPSHSNAGYTGYLATYDSDAEQNLFVSAAFWTALQGATDSAWIGNQKYALISYSNGSRSITTDSDLKNKYGYLVEYGGNGDGSSSNTIPEPGTLLLIGAGLAGLGWSRRRAS